MFEIIVIATLKHRELEHKRGKFYPALHLVRFLCCAQRSLKARKTSGNNA